MTDLLFLVPLFAIGLISSYTDLYRKKIPNSLIACGLIYAFVLYSSLFLYSYFFIGDLSNARYLANGLVNGLIAILVGYFIWERRLWSAGDAKLFAVYAFLLPLKFYSFHYVSFFPSINLLINLFIPLIILLSLTAITIFLKDIFAWFIAKEKNFPKIFSREKTIQFSGQMYYSFAILFLIFMILRTLIPLISGSVLSALFTNPFLLFLFMITLSGKLMAFINRGKWLKFFVLVFFPAHVGYSVCSGNLSLLLPSIRMVFWIWMFFNLVKRALDFYIQNREIVVVSLETIKAGDIFCEQDGQMIKEKLSASGRGGEFGEITAEGLTKEQVVILKEVLSREEPRQIKIYKTFPFAPYLLLSALLCILTKNSLMAVIDSVLKGNML